MYETTIGDLDPHRKLAVDHDRDKKFDRHVIRYYLNGLVKIRDETKPVMIGTRMRHKFVLDKRSRTLLLQEINRCREFLKEANKKKEDNR